MSGDGVGLHVEGLGHDNRVEEYRGLRDFGLLELIGRTGEHDVRNAESEDFVGLLEKLLGNGNVVVEVFTHADSLGPLSGENVCMLHGYSNFFVCRGKDTNLFSNFTPQWFTKDRRSSGDGRFVLCDEKGMP